MHNLRRLAPLRVPAVVLLAGVLTLTSCSSSADEPTTTTTVRVTTTTAPDPTTTTSSSIAPAAPSGPTTPTQPTAQQAGQQLIDAWVAGDPNAAVAAVGSDVANALFSYPTPDNVESLPCRGSETIDGATECDYGDTSGVVTLVITGNASNGYRVTNVGFVPN